ncbi:MAG: hypothetical protein KDD28_15510 [Phaeodactylibacter sp.]|nr:hypothetical protein [Phaeodactylibacter sp.]
MKQLLTAVFVAVAAVSFGQFAGNLYAPYEDFNIRANPVNDTLVSVEIIEAGGNIPANSLRYPPMEKTTARWVVNQWVERQARARAAKEYELIIAKAREKRVISQAEAMGVNGSDGFTAAAILPLFEGEWIFEATGQQPRKMSIDKAGNITGLEQPGKLEARSAFEAVLASGGASMAFVSGDGNTFLSSFDSKFYILKKEK